VVKKEGTDKKDKSKKKGLKIKGKDRGKVSLVVGVVNKVRFLIILSIWIAG